MSSNDQRSTQPELGASAETATPMTRREFARDGAVIGLAGLLGPALFEGAEATTHQRRSQPAQAARAVGLAEYSQYFIGAQGVELARGTVVNGTQISVECQIPADVRHPFAIVLVHGMADRVAIG